MIYRFGNYTINTNLRELYYLDQSLSIEPKVYELIIFFIENSHKAISKDELLDAIWSDLVVSETALSQSIMKARKLLARDGEDYIQTVRGHGYKFIANVSQQSVEQSVENKKAGAKNGASLILLLIFLLSFVGAGYLYLPVSKSSAEDSIAILPFVNHLKGDDFSWTSLGLMSLVSQVLKSKSNIHQVSEWDVMKQQWDSENIEYTSEQIEDIKNQLNANYVVAGQLDQTADGIRLTFSVYHPKGVYQDNQLSGTNPTLMAQQMAHEIAQFLPGKVTAIKNEMVISDDAFINELFSRGMSNLLQGYSDKAYSYIKLTIDHAPELFAPRYQLAIVKREQNKLQEAEDDLIHLIKDFKNFNTNNGYKILALNALGKTHQLQDEMEAAQQAFEQAYQLALDENSLNYQSEVAISLAYMYEKLENLEQAKKWSVTSEVAYQKIYQRADPRNVYLQGKIEKDLGNIDKAEVLYRKALDEFTVQKLYREASSVSNDLSRLLSTKGKYEESLQMLERALELKTELNDIRGIADAKINIVMFLLAEGHLLAAREKLQQAVSYVEQNQVQTKDNYLEKLDIYIDFYQRKYQSVLDKKDKMSPEYQSRTLDMMAMKSRMALGDEHEMKTWLDEYKNYKSGTNNNLRMYYLDMENHYLERYGSQQELIRSYRERIDLTHSLERYTSCTKTRINLAYIYLEQQNYDELTSLMNEIHLHQFNFWEITLLEGVFAWHKGDKAEGKKLVLQAKQNASEFWSERDERYYQKIVKYNG